MSATPLRRAVEHIREAALAPSAWAPALQAVRDATGTESAQLIGFAPGRGALFNWWTAAEDGDLDWLQAVGGNDPAVNSRIRKGMAAPEMAVLDETDFTTDMDCRLNPAYGDIVRRKRTDNICLTNLVIDPEAVVGLAVMRGPEKGNLSAAERRVFTVLAEHARHAVRLRLHAQAQGAAAMTRAVDVTGLAAFLCDRRGVVVDRTAAADALLASDGRLRLAGGRLTLRRHGTDCDLSQAVRAQLATGTPRALVARSGDGGPTLVMEILTLPVSQDAFGIGAAAMLTVRADRAPPTAAPRLSRLFGLSPAEAEIALALLNGLSPEDIADQRAVAVGTVRAQVRALYAKLEVRTQLQFAALMRAAL